MRLRRRAVILALLARVNDRRVVDRFGGEGAGFVRRAVCAVCMMGLASRATAADLLNMTAPISFELPPELAAQLRQAQQGRPRDELAQQHDAVLLESFLSSTYLTLDGRVLTLDHLADSPQLAAVVEPMTAYVALVAGARKLGIPELLELLPARPMSAVTCQRCDGSRWIRFGSRVNTGEPGAIVCPDCHGLGWLLDGEPALETPG